MDHSSKIKRRTRYCGWEDLESIGIPSAPLQPAQLLLAQHQQLLQLQQQNAGNKKAREVYIGNLPVGHSSIPAIKDHFNQVLSILPEYQSKYSSMKQFGAVRDVKLSPCGMFGFVEFWTEELASTALEMDKHDFFGRGMRIGRPSGFVATGPLAPPMDVTELRNQGILPQKVGLGASHDKKLRELYVGNLPAGAINADLIKELFEPACEVMQEFNPSLGPPVISVDLQGDGRFAFVEFQNEALCNAALQIFNGMEVLGRRITVGRPQGYAAGAGSASSTGSLGSLSAPIGAPSAPVQQLTDLVASISQTATSSVGNRLTPDQITAALIGRRM